MSDLQSSIASEEVQIQKHIDRFLGWDQIHVGYCANKSLPPWMIAERTGIEIDEVYYHTDTLKQALIRILEGRHVL